jgi:hypothetical protein
VNPLLLLLKVRETMQKSIHNFLYASREHRIMAIEAVLWLLRQIYDVETGEMQRCLDKLDQLDSMDEGFPEDEYSDVEDEYSGSECAVGHLDSAIEDLEYVYCERS